MREIGGDRSEVWRCQATDAFDASEPLKTSDLRQYWREMTNGNFSLFRFIPLLIRGFFMEVASRVGLLKPTPFRGSGGQSKTAEPLQLKPGDLVQVRPATEIAATLDAGGLSRGLSLTVRCFLIAAEIPCKGQSTADHRRQDRPHAQYRERLHHS